MYDKICICVSHSIPFCSAPFCFVRTIQCQCVQHLKLNLLAIINRQPKRCTLSRNRKSNQGRGPLIVSIFLNRIYIQWIGSTERNVENVHTISILFFFSVSMRGGAKSAMQFTNVISIVAERIVLTIVVASTKSLSQGNQRKFTWYCNACVFTTCNSKFAYAKIVNAIWLQIRRHDCHLTIFPFRWICMPLCSFDCLIIMHGYWIVAIKVYVWTQLINNKISTC